MSGTATAPRAIWSDVSLQRRVVAFILNEMGDDEAYLSAVTSKKTRLATVLKMAKESVAPQVSESTMRRWFQHYMEHGSTQADVRHKRKGSHKGKKKGYMLKSREPNWTPEDTEALRGIVDEHPDLYLDEYQNLFCAARGRFYSPATIWRHLFAEVGYSLKVTVLKARQRDEVERRQYQECLEALVCFPEQLIYLDETAKGPNASRRKRSWAPHGEYPFRDAYFEDHNAKRYSMIAACDVNGFIIETCETIEREHGANDQDETRGTVDRERFRLWVEVKLLPVLGDASRMEDRSIVVMDNASIHHSDEIHELIESTGARVVYLPPYSPDLSPIEFMFGHYKAYLKRHRIGSSWEVTHLEALLSVEPQMARNFFRHCRVPRWNAGNPPRSEEDKRRRECVAAVVALVGVAVATELI
jgi:transposase